MILAHRIQLDTTCAQEAYFRRACGTARFTWNWALGKCKDSYETTRKHPKMGEIAKQWNHVDRPDWASLTHRDCYSRAFQELQDAYSAAFKSKREITAWRKRGCKGKKPREVGFPVFKKKGEHDSFYIANDQAIIADGKIRIPKIGWVRLTEEMRFAGKVMGYRVTRTADKWFVSVQVDVGEYKRERTSDGIVGVDLGIKALAVTSDGQVFENSKPLRSALRRLKRAQRHLSRRVKGSNRRDKARTTVARIHMRIANIRKDTLHKLTTQLCRENQTVVIEDLNVAGMVKNRKLAQAIMDVGFGELRRQLTYKAPIFGSRLVVADRWFRSSKTCSDCGHVLEELPLSVRDWVCPSCGATHDRDLNAANNLRTLGLRETASKEEKLVDSATSAHRKSRWASRLVEARSTSCVPQGDNV